MEKVNFCEALCDLLEYFLKKKLLQFQENSFVMKHFYKIILVQYNETLWKRYRTTKLAYTVYLGVFLKIIFGKEKEAK